MYDGKIIECETLEDGCATLGVEAFRCEVFGSRASLLSGLKRKEADVERLVHDIMVIKELLRL